MFTSEQLAGEDPWNEETGGFARPKKDPLERSAQWLLEVTITSKQ
jgi:hypothetical protein